MRAVLLIPPGLALGLTLACADTTAPTPPAPPPAAPPPAPEPPEVERVDEAACAASLAAGPAAGVWTADLGSGNGLSLHLHHAGAVDGVVAGLPAPGTAVSAWAVLSVRDIEALIDVALDGDARDPGAVCLASLVPAGTPYAGNVFQDDRYPHNLDLVLTGALPPATAQDVLGRLGALADARWVPWPDVRADGRPFLSLRLGAVTPQGHATALEGERLRGDVVVALSDGKGRAVYANVRAR